MALFRNQEALHEYSVVSVPWVLLVRCSVEQLRHPLSFKFDLPYRGLANAHRHRLIKKKLAVGFARMLKHAIVILHGLDTPFLRECKRGVFIRTSLAKHDNFVQFRIYYFIQQ